MFVYLNTVVLMRVIPLRSKKILMLQCPRIPQQLKCCSETPVPFLTVSAEMYAASGLDRFKAGNQLYATDLHRIN